MTDITQRSPFTAWLQAATLLGSGPTKESPTPYHVRLAVFEGPLDLLLQLIEQRELDITEVSLALVTDQYLQHIQELATVRPEDLVEFLSIAVQLLLIKSRLLLPAPPRSLCEEAEEGDLDSGQTLMQRLEAYRRYRDVAEQLRSWEGKGQRAFPRAAGPDIRPFSLPEGAASPLDLVAALESLLPSRPSTIPVSRLISPLTITIDDRMTFIRDAARAEGRLTFRSLISTPMSRAEVIVTFLALLELMRLREVVARQESTFGEIFIAPNPAL